jgi:hypothetical protein
MLLFYRQNLNDFTKSGKMKTNTVLILTLFIVIFASCERESYINFGFDSPVNKDSKGIVVVDISHSYDRVFLSGHIRLSEGAVEVILVNPNGVTVFSKTLVAPDELHVNETFEATRGFWKMEYTSRNGKGYIDLHVSNF